MDMVKKLFGGGDDSSQQQQQAQDFVNRYQQGAPDQGYTDQEAAQHYQNVAQNADPATIQRAAEQTFNGMDPAQRTQVSQMLQQQGGGGSSDPREMAGTVAQLHQQNPGGLASMFGMGGGSGGGGIGGMIGSALGGGGNSSGSGGGGFPGGTLGKVALGGIAAYAMKEVMGGGGGLGGLLGGGGGGNDSSGRSV